MKNVEDFEHCAHRLKALADAERLRIVQCLLDGPRNVSEIAEALSDEIVRVSHHLGVLRNAGLVLAEKQGRFVVYSLPATVCSLMGRDGKPGLLNLGCCTLDMNAGKVADAKR